MQIPKIIPGQRLQGNFLLSSLALLIVLSAAPLTAANGGTASDGGGLDFTLQLARSELNLKAANNLYPVDLKRITVVIFEESAADFKLGLMAGSSYLSLAQDSPSTGLNLSGFHLGILGRRTFGSNPRITLQGHGLFQQTRDSAATNTVMLDWFEWQLASRLRLAIGQNWGLTVGAAYSGVDAERRVTGSTNNTLGMNLKKPLHGELGVEMLSAPDGRVNLTLFGGGQRGLRLGFARRF